MKIYCTEYKLSLSEHVFYHPYFKFTCPSRINPGTYYAYTELHICDTELDYVVVFKVVLLPAKHGLQVQGIYLQVKPVPIVSILLAFG